MSDGTPTNVYTLSSPGAIVPGQWHHLGLVVGFQAANPEISHSVGFARVALYVDGVLVSEDIPNYNTPSQGIQQLTYEQTIFGADLDGQSQPYDVLKGQIDEVRRWYRYFLGVDEFVDFSLNTALSGDEVHLSALWHLDETSSALEVVLNGSAEMNLAFGDTYEELGAMVTHADVVIVDSTPNGDDGTL